MTASTYSLYYCILRSRCSSARDETRRGEATLSGREHGSLGSALDPPDSRSTGGCVRTFHTTRHAAPAWPASFLPRTVLCSSMYMSRSLAALHSCSHDGPLATELTLSHEVKCVGLVMPHACTRHLPSGPQPPSHHRTRSLNEKFLFLLHQHSNTNIRTPHTAASTPIATLRQHTSPPQHDRFANPGPGLSESPYRHSHWWPDHGQDDARGLAPASPLLTHRQPVQKGVSIQAMPYGDRRRVLPTVTVSLEDCASL